MSTDLPPAALKRHMTEGFRALEQVCERWDQRGAVSLRRWLREIGNDRPLHTRQAAICARVMHGFEHPGASLQSIAHLELDWAIGATMLGVRLDRHYATIAEHTAKIAKAADALRDWHTIELDRIREEADQCAP